MSHTDDLVAEYMRVINHKDSEILDLMAKVERLDLEAKKREDRHRTKILELKSTVRELQTISSETERSKTDYAREMSTLKDERDRLASDVSTLRSALQRHEDHLKGVLKTSTKAHKHEAFARDRVETDMRDLKRAYEEKAQTALDRIGALEVQLAAAQRRVTEVTEDAHRWRQESKRWKEAASERDAETAELKNRIRDMLPKEEIAAELKQADERHRVLVEKLEKEVKRLRGDVVLEASSSTRKDTVTMQIKGDLQRAEQELVTTKRANQDLELALAQERLMHSQRQEELKSEMEARVSDAREQLSKVVADRHKLEGEVAILRQRLLEVEEHQESTTRAWAEAERGFEQEIHDLKVLAGDKRREAETNARLAQQLQTALQTSSDQVDARINKVQKELVKQREEAEVQQLAAGRASDALLQKEGVISDLRREVQRLTGIESELKRRLIDAESGLQSAMSEQRMLAAQHAEEIRELRVAEHRVRQDLQREISQLQSRLATVEGESLRFQSQLQVAEEKEKQLMKAQREADSELTRVQVFIAEKEAILTTLRRNNESSATSLSTCQAQLENARKNLSDANTDNERLQTELSRLRAVVQTKDAELVDVQRSLQRIEDGAREHGTQSENEISSLQQRLRSVTSQLSETEHRLSLEIAEKVRLDASKSEEIQRLHRDVIAPLHEKVDNVTKMCQRAESVNREKDDRLAVLSSVTSERDELRRQCETMQNELTRSRSSIATLHDTERDLTRERDASRRQRGEIDGLLAKIAGLEASLDAATRELSDLHTREVTLVTQMSNKHAELSALNERYANADSLRKISEKQVHELQQREQELLSRLEESKTSYNVLQACFDKQQEQLETSRRYRELDLASRERSR